jgi:hypothetical protein
MYPLDSQDLQMRHLTPLLVVLLMAACDGGSPTAPPTEPPSAVEPPPGPPPADTASFAVEGVGDPIHGMLVLPLGDVVPPATATARCWEDWPTGTWRELDYPKCQLSGYTNGTITDAIASSEPGRLVRIEASVITPGG